MTGSGTCSQTALIGLQPRHRWRLQALASESTAEPVNCKCYVCACVARAQTSRAHLPNTLREEARGVLTPAAPPHTHTHTRLVTVVHLQSEAFLWLKQVQVMQLASSPAEAPLRAPLYKLLEGIFV